MSKTKNYYMERTSTLKGSELAIFGDLEREYLINDMLAKEDSTDFDLFKQELNQSSSKIKIGHARQFTNTDKIETSSF